MGFIYGCHIWGSYIGVIWWIYMGVLCGGQMGVIWGSNGGQIGVKLYLSSDLHHIWWEGAFLLVIKGSFIRFAIF